MLRRGAAWLGQHQNSDGGWGDTIDSPSNLSTTLLAVAALKLAGDAPDQATALDRAGPYIARWTGGNPNGLAEAVQRIYGQDRTFAVPILMNCALADLVSWEDIPNLPFELAAVPHSGYKLLRLQVVSYALPALIAIGMLVHRRHPPRSVLVRILRRAVETRVLEKLQRIQPPTGGFLEATPLTSFVAMSLIPLLGPDHPVAAKCLSFIRQSQRPDGSWPIDTNLSVWLTTAAISALASTGQLSRIPVAQTAGWIRAQQYTCLHPYTHARPGGWGWTHLSGGVPDVDDTSGAVLALAELRQNGGIAAGVDWLLTLQNADGGWPTFCRGWGKLPFDQSAPDLTAHAIRAFHCADPTQSNRRIQRAILRGFRYLVNTQQADGSWLPLWFGNQQHTGQTNPVVGTARVLLAWEVVNRRQPEAWRGVRYLSESQNSDGGWGGGRGVGSSMEETALAVTALAGWSASPQVGSNVAAGARYLIQGIEQGALERPSPIGLYFASLWYSERLYPIIWTLEALGRAKVTLTGCGSGSATTEAQRRTTPQRVPSTA
jgi:squalene-hopene/tetraprenyl-beta-curcumene cyclase